MAWKRDSEEAEVVACDEDMIRACEYHGGELRGIVNGDGEQGRGQTPPHGHVYHLPSEEVSRRL